MFLYSNYFVKYICNIEYIICRFLYSLQSGYRKYIYILNSTKNFVIDLFKDRNILGKFLSSVIFLLSIPGMLFVTILAIVDVFVKLCIKIWKLGDR